MDICRRIFLRLFIIEEYFYENQIEEINSYESLETLKDGEFTEENSEPVE